MHYNTDMKMNKLQPQTTTWDKYHKYNTDTSIVIPPSLSSLQKHIPVESQMGADLRPQERI